MESPRPSSETRRAVGVLGLLLLAACGRPAPERPGPFDEDWSQGGAGASEPRTPAGDVEVEEHVAEEDVAEEGGSEAVVAEVPAGEGTDADAAAPPVEPVLPEGATALTLEDLGWPADTRSVEIRKTIHARFAPSRKAHPAGKVVGGSRVPWRQLVAVEDRRCPRWVELEPRGWLCADRVTPSKEAPAAVALPVVKPGSLVPGTYHDVGEGGSVAYANADDVRAGVVKEELATAVMLHSRGELEIDGVDYHRTNKGLVPAGDLSPLSPSTWAGVDLRVTPPPAWPFAFVRRGAALTLRAAPHRKAASVGTRRGRTLVAFGAEQDGYVEVAPGAWAPRRELRKVALTAPPPGVGPDERWIDIDLDEQVLVAYRGATPELATLVSTGRVAGTTPVATYQVRAMAATTRMLAEPHEKKQYDIGEVPWAIRFRKGLFLHAAFWHDGFGERRSAGCVNLSPRDARLLYEWVGGVPDGWSEVEVERGRGLVIRVRDASTPEPPVYDYADESTP